MLAPRAKLKRVRAVYSAVRILVYMLLVWPQLLRLRVHGRRNIPRTGPVLVAVNHLSEFDFMVVAAAISRDMTFLVQGGVFSGAIGRFLRWLGHIPVYRGTTRAYEASAAGIATLRAGGLVVIFPEGRCSPPDGVLRPGMGGLAYMAAATGTPVVPIGVAGTDEVFPLKLKGYRGPLFRLFRRVRVDIGTPISAAELAAMAADSTAKPAVLREARQVFTDNVMRAIAALSGQTFSGDIPNWTETVLSTRRKAV